MHTCPNCASEALGNDLVSACSSCAEIAVAGASMPMTAIFVAAVITLMGFVASRVIKSLRRPAARLA